MTPPTLSPQDAERLDLLLKHPYSDMPDPDILLLKRALEAAHTEIARLRTPAGDAMEAAELAVSQVHFDNRIPPRVRQNLVEAVAAALTAAEARGREAERERRNPSLTTSDARLPHGWMWEARRFYNLPGADYGYAMVWSPHIDEPKIEVYGRTPEAALKEAIDRATSEGGQDAP